MRYKVTIYYLNTSVGVNLCEQEMLEFREFIDEDFKHIGKTNYYAVQLRDSKLCIMRNSITHFEVQEMGK